jgi:hypothetical protein
MSSLALSIGSLIVGVLATTWISRYYFKRTVGKALTPYMQFHSSLFDGVDPSVRESLKIAYKGTAVSELTEVQFLIANTGERPIRDLLAPLSLVMPSGCSLLDASVLHISPEGREVKIVQTTACVMFVFPLLNAREFFITKLLLQGKAKRKDFKFTVTVDDLPPTLKAIPLPLDLIDYEHTREFDWGLLILGLIVLLVACSVAALIYLQRAVLFASWHTGIVSTFRQNWLVLVSSAVAALPALILLVLGPMLMVGACTDFSFPKRRRFRVPAALLLRHIYLSGGRPGPNLFLGDDDDDDSPDETSGPADAKPLEPRKKQTRT